MKALTLVAIFYPFVLYPALALFLLWRNWDAVQAHLIAQGRIGEDRGRHGV